MLRRITAPALAAAALWLGPSSAAAATTPEALSVNDAVRLAVAHNVELLQERLIADRAAALDGAAWLAFTPVLNVGTAVDNGVPVLVDDKPKLATGTTSNVGVGWLSPIGTRVDADVGFTRITDGAAKAATVSTLTLTIAQPVLQGAWLGGAGAALDEASLQRKIAEEGLRRELESFVVDVESAYWDLALAQADVQIKAKSLAQAQQQYDDTAENIRRGILADVEIYLVDENRVFFEAQLAQAVEERENARRHLAQLMWLDPDAPIVVAEDLSHLDSGDSFAGIVDQSAEVARGLDGNPGLAQRRVEAQLARNRERSAAVAALPSLDVVGSLGMSTTGTAGASAFDKLVGGAAQPTGNVGLQLSVPLAPPPVQAGVTAAHLDAARARLDVESAELHLRHDLESAIGALYLGLKIEKLGRDQLVLAEKKLQAQEDKYKNGISTLADVVRFQRELDDASIALRVKVRAVHVARARLLALQGRLAGSMLVDVRGL